MVQQSLVVYNKDCVMRMDRHLAIMNLWSA